MHYVTVRDALRITSVVDLQVLKYHQPNLEYEPVLQITLSNAR